ncbi:MAG: protein translocase subunit SecD [Peptococcaceae bacterium]|jgi:preprotein translocase subunit SecD|nr:protein translocase subunit SecD [Peptococcaceae bacterium]
MKAGKATAVILVLVLTVVCAYLGVVYLGDYLKLGLDLRGGVQVRIQAVGEATRDDLDRVIAVMDSRINGLGVTEPTIQREGDNRILLELPGVQDPDEALDMIGRTGFLTFRTFDGEGNETVVLDGSNLLSAKEAVESGGGTPGNLSQGGYVVQLTFNAEGQRIFADTTRRLVSDYGGLTSSAASDGDLRRNIAIYLDDELISMPYVTTVIPDGNAVITGYSSLAEARQLALTLQSGALPMPVEIVEKRTIGPTLGADSIAKSQMAGLVGLALVILFMIAFYRLPGVFAGFSLILYSFLLLGAMALIKATLTLPGILGIILTIGMCIDANIIIYERMLEEMGRGKSLRAAIDAGFSRALWTIVDSNVTTLIAAAVLFWKGTGSIRGFAVTLSLGILISMFTAITYSRFLLKNTVESGLVKNPVLYGGKPVIYDGKGAR